MLSLVGCLSDLLWIIYSIFMVSSEAKVTIGMSAHCKYQQHQLCFHVHLSGHGQFKCESFATRVWAVLELEEMLCVSPPFSQGFTRCKWSARCGVIRSIEATPFSPITTDGFILGDSTFPSTHTDYFMTLELSVSLQRRTEPRCLFSPFMNISFRKLKAFFSPFDCSNATWARSENYIVIGLAGRTIKQIMKCWLIVQVFDGANIPSNNRENWDRPYRQIRATTN